jgi:hypothetical protein
MLYTCPPLPCLSIFICIIFISIRSFDLALTIAWLLRVVVVAVMMFLGGSYHHRDNPPANSVEPHDGKTMLLMTLVRIQKEGDSRAAAARLRTRTGDDLTMMRMNIFYGGTGTKCTENKILTWNDDNEMIYRSWKHPMEAVEAWQYPNKDANDGSNRWKQPIMAATTDKHQPTPS